MEKTLPVNIKDLSDGTAKKQPWLLFAMPVNAMNYCSFAMCRDGILQMDLQTQEIEKGPSLEPILLTVPNALDSSGVLPSLQPTLTSYLRLLRSTYSSFPVDVVLPSYTRIEM